MLMAALGKLPEYLAGIDARLVNIIHDEIVLEVSEEDMFKAMEAVEKAMIDGMLAIFPQASTKGLVDINVGDNWAKAK